MHSCRAGGNSNVRYRRHRWSGGDVLARENACGLETPKANIMGEHTSAQIGFHLAGPGTIERDEHDAWFRQRRGGGAKARSQQESEKFSPGHKAHYGDLLIVRQ